MPFDGQYFPPEKPKIEDPTLWQLRRARQLIDEDGWVQGHAGGPDTGYCTSGALYAAMLLHGRVTEQTTGNFGSTYAIKNRPRDYIFGLPIGREHNIPGWNDAPTRRVEHVRRYLDRLIERRQRELKKVGIHA
jgi:hypothetical protein